MDVVNGPRHHNVTIMNAIVMKSVTNIMIVVVI